MPFIPHSESDVSAMLKAIGVARIEDLFDEIPAALKIDQLKVVPPGLNEFEVTRLMKARAAQDGTPLNFCGAGAYEHHIPAAVWAIVSRGEFYLGLHALPGGGESGHAAADLRIPNDDDAAYRHGREQCVDVRRCHRAGRSGADGRALREEGAAQGTRAEIGAPGVPQDAAHDRRSAEYRDRRNRCRCEVWRHRCRGARQPGLRRFHRARGPAAELSSARSRTSMR